MVSIEELTRHQVRCIYPFKQKQTDIEYDEKLAVVKEGICMSLVAHWLLLRSKSQEFEVSEVTQKLFEADQPDSYLNRYNHQAFPVIPAGSAYREGKKAKKFKFGEDDLDEPRLTQSKPLRNLAEEYRRGIVALQIQYMFRDIEEELNLREVSPKTVLHERYAEKLTLKRLALSIEKEAAWKEPCTPDFNLSKVSTVFTASVARKSGAVLILESEVSSGNGAHVIGLEQRCEQVRVFDPNVGCFEMASDKLRGFLDTLWISEKPGYKAMYSKHAELYWVRDKHRSWPS